MRDAARRAPVAAPEVRVVGEFAPSAVDAYWAAHTVYSTPFRSGKDSERYLEWRFREYPLFREFQELWGEHAAEVILDYGCGPGHDLIGFLLYTDAWRVIGIDVSWRSLGLASSRVALHRVDLDRVELLQTGDASTTIALADESVDFVNCGGVLHHTSHPAAILREFHRVLRPGGRANLMVYNRGSIWFHLYTAYVRVIVEGRFPGLAVDEVFARSTDGERCPISRAYASETVLAMADAAGFEAEFVGGYLSRGELTILAQFAAQALADDRLPAEHANFLRRLVPDAQGLPMFGGKHAGIGGSYLLRRR